MTDVSSEQDHRSAAVVNLVGVAMMATVTYAGVQWIYNTQPTAQQQEYKRKSAALVETLQVERRTWTPTLSVLGTVRAAQEIQISPRVRGQVLSMSESFAPGQMIQQGEVLLQIDPADFENTVSIRRSELEQVEASWRIEQGRQSLAEQELKLLGDSIDEVNRALVLREPQAASLKSQLNAAKAALDRAELDLSRTQLTAPFSAQVLRRSVNVGSQVQTGDDLGQLVGVDEYWVMAAVPVRNLRWIQFADRSDDGSSVQLSDVESWGPGVVRTGQVSRMIGSLDEETRLARVLITVPDPLGLQSDVMPLILDTIIDVRIECSPIDDVVRLPRDHIHEKETVWVMAGDKLEIRTAEIAFRDSEYAYIRNGLDDGDEVVVTTLATVADGVLLRKVGTASQDAESESADPAAAQTLQGSRNPKETAAAFSSAATTGAAGDAT